MTDYFEQNFVRLRRPYSRRSVMYEAYKNLAHAALQGG